MSSKVPTTKQVAWVSLVPHIFVLAIFILLYHLIDVESVVLYAALTFLLLSFALRNFVPKDHREGIRKNNKGKFEEALLDFEKSYLFFKKYEWIDKYRYITLLSSSKISYREMALVNIAFCYSQIGNSSKSKEYYLRTLDEFPESMMAKTALNFIDSFEKSKS